MAMLMKSVVSQSIVIDSVAHFPLEKYDAQLEAAFAEAAEQGAVFEQSNMTLSQVYYRQPTSGYT